MNGSPVPGLLLTSAVSFAVAVPCTWAVREVALKMGLVARPRDDRWHSRPTALFGGIAIVIATLVPLVLLRSIEARILPLVISATAMAVVGAIDDRVSLRPSTRLVAQLVCASALVFLGFSLWPSGPPLAARAVTLVWIIAITNALNLLDNMDGLCAGIGTIAAIAFVLTRSILPAAIEPEALFAAGLAGALLGFLLFNFKPASIFMGDAGSLFIGISLAGLAAAPGATAGANIITVLAVPVLILAIPIFDTLFVTVLRKLAGRPASQGGRDHTSHRLVAMGFSERRAVLILYTLAGASAALGILLRQFGVRNLHVVIAFLLLVLLLFGVRLARVQVYSDHDVKRLGSGVTPLLFRLMYKRRILETVLDSALITLAYYSAYWIRFEGAAFDFYYPFFVRSMPVILACKILGLLAAGVYGGVWRYFSLSDLTTYLRGLLFGSLASIVMVLYLFRFEQFSRGVFIIDGMLLLLLVVGSRLSFRALGEAAQRGRSSGRPAVIYGAGDGGAMLVRELLNNEQYGFRPIGFIDDDPDKRGTRVQGYQVLGTLGDLPRMVADGVVQAVVISTDRLDAANLREVMAICRSTGTGLIRLQFRVDQIVETT